MTVPEVPTAWVIPDSARREWRRLTAALEDVIPACEADPDKWADAADPDGDAARTCHQCPARVPCREYGVAAREAGIWGGINLTIHTRQNLEPRR